MCLYIGFDTVQSVHQRIYTRMNMHAVFFDKLFRLTFFKMKWNSELFDAVIHLIFTASDVEVVGCVLRNLNSKWLVNVNLCDVYAFS